MTFKTIRTFVVGVALSAGLANSAEAQPPAWDCGKKCQRCSGGVGWEGYEHQATGGIYNMDCFLFIPNCVSCVVERTNDGERAERLLARIGAAPQSALRTLVQQGSGRLYLSPDQKLVVLLGTKCDPRAVATVAKVSTSTAAALRQVGVTVLETGRLGG